MQKLALHRKRCDCIENSLSRLRRQGLRPLKEGAFWQRKWIFGLPL